MSNLPPSRTADRIIIRLPDGMRDRLMARAKAHKKTMTAEVVDILATALNRASEGEYEALQAEMKGVEAGLEAARETFWALENRRRTLLGWMSSLKDADEQADRWDTLLLPGQRVETEAHGAGSVIEYLTEATSIHPEGRAVYLVKFDDDGSERQVSEKDITVIEG